MAKTTPGLKQALKVVKQLGKQMNAESMADYGVAASASKAASANLAKQTRALTRDLVLGQRFNQAAVAGYRDRALASQRKVASRQEATVNRYGEALGASVSESYGGARATATSGVQVARGAVKGSNQAAMAARTVAGIAAAGVQAGKQAAAYSMNQALMARNMVTAETLAGLTGQLYQTAMEYNMQWDLWKKQQDYAAKKAEEAGGFENKKDAVRLMSEGGDIASAAADTYRDLKNAAGEDFDPKTVNVTEAALDYANKNAYDPNGPEVKLYASTLRNLKASTVEAPVTADVAYGDAMRTLFAGAKGYDKWGEAVISGGKMQVIMDQTRSAFQDWIASNDAWWEDGQGPVDPATASGGFQTYGVAPGQPYGRYGLIRDAFTS